MSLIVSPNADMSDAVSYSADISTLPTTTATPVTISIPVESPAADMYYRLSIEMPKVYSEGVFSVNSLKYYAVPSDDGSQIVSLDFTEKQTLLEAYIGGNTIAPGSEYAETGTNNLNDASFKVGVVSVTLKKADGAITPRWWESKTITPELRLNPDNLVVFEIVKSGYRLTEVKFLLGNVSVSYYNALDASDAVTNLGASAFADKRWTAPEEGSVTNLTLKINDYSRCGGIRMTYIAENNDLAGIEGISSVIDDSASPVEYFNLSGVRFNAENLFPGLYIRKQGRRTSKIFVR